MGPDRSTVVCSQINIPLPYECGVPVGFVSANAVHRSRFQAWLLTPSLGRREHAGEVDQQFMELL